MKINKKGIKQIFGIATLISALLFYSGHAVGYSIDKFPRIKPKMNINFSNVTNKKIKKAFKVVFEKYDHLHKYKIYLHRENLSGSTMMAQPKIDFFSLFTNAKAYEITLSENVFETNIPIESLPQEVIEGWFAHELGHVVDYEQHSNFEMIFFGLKYLTSSAFKRKVEHRADHFAIEQGFKKEIIASTEFLLNEPEISESYKDKLENYYMAVEDIEKVD